MSNFLNSGFSDLNALTNIDADEIRTATLYVNGILIEPNSNIFDVITCSKLICQYDISCNTLYATTSIQGVPVSKFAYLTNITSDIQEQLNNFCLQSDYLTLKAQADATKNILTGASYNSVYGFIDFSYNMHVYGVLYANYNNNVLDVSYILYNLPTTYVSNSSLATTLSNYCLQSDYLTLKAQADVTTIILTGASYSSAYGGYINFENNMHIYGALYLGPDNNLINVNDTLYNLPTNYCSQSNYLALKNITDSLTALLVNIEHINGFGLNFYEGINVFGPMLVTVNGNYLNVGSILNGLSSNYCSQSNYLALKSQSDANSVLIATNTTSIAGLVIASAAQQAQITALAGTVGAVQAGLFDVQQDITTLQENTEYITVGGILTRYTQFAGDGIKMMNGVGYSVIINVNGESQWYGLMTLADGLEVENGIITDRITISDDLYNTGTTTLANTTINGTLGVTGVSTLANTTINGTLGVTGVSTLSTTNLPNGNLTVTTGNLIVTAGKLEINAGVGAPFNYIGNNSVFNGSITGTNLTMDNITSNTLITGYDITINHNIICNNVLTSLNIQSTNLSSANITCNTNLTANNLTSTNINCNNYNCSNSNGNNVVLIATNGGGFLSGNNITIGNLYSTTYIAGLVVFQGANFNMSGLIDQIG